MPVTVKGYYTPALTLLRCSNCSAMRRSASPCCADYGQHGGQSSRGQLGDLACKVIYGASLMPEAVLRKGSRPSPRGPSFKLMA